MWNKGTSAALIVCAAIWAASVRAQESAGQVLWTFGQVERVTDGVARPLSKGDTVFEGDEVRAASGSHAQLVMSDQALLAVRPDSSVRIDAYVYRGGEAAGERALMELLKGGMRSVTGAIGYRNKDDYRIRTRTHLIGIRGTDHETFVTEQGTYSRVTVGGTYLQSADGRLDLTPGQVGFASLLPGIAPSRLERTPEFMHHAVLRGSNAGPALRDSASIDRQRTLKRGPGDPSGAAPMPGSPALGSPALAGDSHRRGFGAGGRCGGPCADLLNNNDGVFNKSKGKAKGRGPK